MYKELALTAREAEAYFGGSAVTWWRHGDEEMVESSERKGDQLYNLLELYERETVKATSQLYEPISSSDVLLNLPINWGGAVLLGPSFLRLLWGSIGDHPRDCLSIWCLGNRFLFPIVPVFCYCSS